MQFSIKTEQNNTDHNFIRISTGLVNKRKLRWMKHEERIVNILSDYKKAKLVE
jgi:hypothetical protein